MYSTYTYRPLAPPSIRLIRILEEQKLEGQDDSQHHRRDDRPIRCKLVHLPPSGVPRVPEYIAISYVWGKEDTRTIILDGQRFEIPTNLWHALRRCRAWESIDTARDNDPRRGYGPRHITDTIFCVRRPWLFWADAICVNQADGEEKAREIPRMLDIFGSAKEVMGWLLHIVPPGINEATVGHALDVATAITDSAQKEQKEEESPASKDQDRQSTESTGLKGRPSWVSMWLGNESHLRQSLGLTEMQMADLAQNIFTIASLPWFRRLWIVQEYVAAQVSVALVLGPHLFDAFAFHHLFVLFSYRRAWSPHLNCAISMSRISDQLHKLGSGESKKNYKVARVPTLEHDMVYGLLGLALPLPDPMPSELTINYSVPWVLVCQHYARFIAEQTGDITFLARVRPVQNICRQATQLRGGRDNREGGGKDNNTPGSRGLPSWVPGFTCQSMVTSPAPWHFHEPDRSRGHRIIFTETVGGLAMTLDAIVLGKPATMTTNTNLVQVQEEYYDEATPPPPFLRSEAHHFIRGVLRPAASLQKRALEDVMTSWISMLESTVDHHKEPSEAAWIRKTFASWALGKDTSSRLRHLDKGLDPTRPKIAGRTFSSRGRNVWGRMRDESVNKNCIVTQDGLGWLALFLDELHPDRDVVALLRGLEDYPALLRESPGDDGTSCDSRRYSFVGLLLERVPLAGKVWEKCWLQELGGLGSLEWSRITII
ncbi:heterokaryon incompatibility protein-domain-containing protein [Microdochium bolleyi]|uniref:Heterokaryon incompatibility protein-domain-containing protein n=1 Tax=Microdochium bolleyi TaxID=196109 RepID=A0A136IML6_9PEZI|nr:heterokaryon incompatibility protein-domain-containing protein [Microdochium bolleyi]